MCMILQLISGVTVDEGSLEEFKAAFVKATALALGVDEDAVVMSAVDLVTVRRNLRDRDASVHRRLGSTSTVKISFTVATSATATSVITSLTNAAPTVSNALTVVGAIEGFVAVVGAPVIDLSTAAPANSPIERTDEVTEAPIPAPVIEPTPAPVDEVTEAPIPAPVIEPTPAPVIEPVDDDTEGPTPAGDEVIEVASRRRTFV